MQPVQAKTGYLHTDWFLFASSWNRSVCPHFKCRSSGVM